MPHLDASALLTDQDGLEFLSKVLEGPADPLPVRRSFGRPSGKGLRVRSKVVGEVNRPRRLAPLPEAV